MTNIKNIHEIGRFKIEEYDGDTYVIRGLLNAEYCDRVREFIETSEDMEYNEYEETQNVVCYSKKFLDLEESPERKKKLGDLQSRFKNIYIKAIVYLIDQINSNIFIDTIPKHSGIILRKITGKTRLHCDGTHMEKGFIRNLSCVIGLNSDYESGRWSFPDYQTSMRIDKGDVLLFPPYWSHLHTVEKPLKGYRYTITFWFCESDSYRGYEITNECSKYNLSHYQIKNK